MTLLEVYVERYLQDSSFKFQVVRHVKTMNSLRKLAFQLVASKLAKVDRDERDTSIA